MTNQIRFLGLACLLVASSAAGAKEIYVNNQTGNERGTGTHEEPLRSARRAVAMAGPGDVIWLEKSKAIGDSTRLYQVLASDGSLARIVRVSGFGRVRGASADRVLVTRFVDGAVRLYEQELPARSAAGQ